MLTSGMNLAQYFLLFVIYSFVGWVCEVIYCSIPAKHFINRGFLHGPICPVYGFGGLIIMTLLSPLHHTWLPLFFASVGLTTLLEYLTSWLLETLFSTKWWDYSNHKFNLKGRICLLNSILFGILGLLASHFVHPLVVSFIFQVSITVVDYVAVGISIVLFGDLMVSIRGLVNFNEEMVKLKDFSESIKEHYENEEWYKSINEKTLFGDLRLLIRAGKLKMSERMQSRLDQLSGKQWHVERLMHAFPSMSSKKYETQLSTLRQHFLERLDAKKNKKN